MVKKYLLMGALVAGLIYCSALYRLHATAAKNPVEVP